VVFFLLFFFLPRFIRTFTLAAGRIFVFGFHQTLVLSIIHVIRPTSICPIGKPESQGERTSPFHNDWCTHPIFYSSLLTTRGKGEGGRGKREPREETCAPGHGNRRIERGQATNKERVEIHTRGRREVFSPKEPKRVLEQVLEGHLFYNVLPMVVRVSEGRRNSYGDSVPCLRP
jgi:hypothetical protein